MVLTNQTITGTNFVILKKYHKIAFILIFTDLNFKGLLFLVLSFVAFSSFSQCSIDYNYSPSGYNYGLSPDTLPIGVQGQVYNEDLTFFLPLDTTDSGLTVTFTDFHITSINLPIGMTWECSNSFNGCHYDPSIDQYGCVNLGGVPLQSGIYSVDVELVATHNLSALAGTVPISFSLPLEILPDTSSSSNSGFAMVGNTGCSPIQVSFTNNNPGMAAYMWDFGNGNISMLENPGPQIYNSPGTYIVNYEAYSTTSSSYFLTNVEVVDADGWDGDAEDGFGLLSPDPFIIIKDQSGNTIYTSSIYVDQNFPVSWSINNIPLQNQTYTIEVWDQDGPFTADDFCGSLTFSGFSNSGTIMGGGEIINYSTLEIPPTPITITDTVNVFSYPSVPNIMYDTLSNLIYTDSSYFAMQWYYYNSPIPNATDSSFNPSSSGLYSILGINEYGCVTSSNDLLVIICDSIYQPSLQLNGSNFVMLDSALYPIYQWYHNNITIPNATNPYFNANSSGMYSIHASDTFGCTYVSNQVLYCDGNQQPTLDNNLSNVWVSDSLNYISYDWLLNGVNLNINNSILSTGNSGMYSVVAEDVYGCQYLSPEVLVCDQNFTPLINSIGSVAWVSDSAGYSIQWYLDGNILINETNSTIFMSSTGNYSALLIDQFGCDYWTNSISNISSNYNNLELKEISIFPNPSKDLIFITNLDNDKKYSIVDLKGDLILSGITKNHSINISSFDSGIYFLSLELNGVMIIKKIIKF